LENVDTTLELRGSDLGQLLEDGAPPPSLATEDPEDAFAQILDRNGRVLAASANVEGAQALVDRAPGSYFTWTDNPIDDAPLRVHTLRTSGDDPVTILVAATLEDVDETLAVTERGLLLGLPLLLGLVAVTTWVVVGKTLQPVEAIRTEVAEIGGSDLHRRVPQPADDDEIGRLAATMNSMLRRLEEASERQQQFVSDASHELRTPIATIRHELEVAFSGDGTDWRNVAAEVLDEDLRMQRLVDDLLWLARHDQDDESRGAGRARRQSLVDLDEIVDAEARRRRADPSPRVDTSGIGAGQVRGSADELRRVVRNLLDNACRHAGERVAVRLTAADGSVVVHVDDDGGGVAPEDRSRIFERFTRLDEARARDEGGAGLGLAIAAEIIRAHGGSLGVSVSPVLGGARFTVGLPDERAADRPADLGAHPPPHDDPASPQER